MLDIIYNEGNLNSNNTHSLEWLRTQAKPKSKQNTSNTKCQQVSRATGTLIAGRMQNGTDTLGNSLAVPYKDRHILTVRLSNPRYLPKRNKQFSSHKKLYMNAFCSFLYNYSELETQILPTIEWVN